MEYLRNLTDVPAPRVLDWSDDPLNEVRTEFIIMEYVDGVQLRDHWDAMSPREHVLCVKSLARLLKQLYALEFPAYGSIYFDSAPVDPNHRIPLTNGFFIGPSLTHRYWPECGPGEGRWYERRPPNRGPCRNFEAFRRSLLDASVSHFPPETAPGALDYYGSVQENIEVLDALDSVTSQLSHDPQLREFSEPKLLHQDLHMRNIFVSGSDSTKITGLIDWQSTTLDPILLHAHKTPDLCSKHLFAEDLLDEDGEDGEDEDEDQGQDGEGADASDSSKKGDVLTAAERANAQADAERCLQAWQLSLLIHAPKLHAARALDEALLRPFRQSFSTWQYGATAARDVLKGLAAQWQQLGLPGTCAYQPTAEELARDAKRAEDLQAVLTLERWHQQALGVGSDGWVRTDRWEEVLELHEEFYNNWMEAARTAGDEGMTEEKAARMWPFDSPEALRRIGRKDAMGTE